MLREVPLRPVQIVAPVLLMEGVVLAALVMRLPVLLGVLLALLQSIAQRVLLRRLLALQVIPRKLLVQLAPLILGRLVLQAVRQILPARVALLRTLRLAC